MRVGRLTDDIERHLLQVGEIAFSGLLENQLLFREDEFSLCPEAMETACRVGVLSQQKEFIPRRDKTGTDQVPSKVLFPHKLFQEYLSGMFLANLFKTNKEQFDKFINEDIVPKATEFRHLLYFTTSQNGVVGSEILSKLTKVNPPWQFSNITVSTHFVVDVTFECQDENVNKSVGRSIFQEKRDLEIHESILPTLFPAISSSWTVIQWFVASSIKLSKY